MFTIEGGDGDNSCIVHKFFGTKVGASIFHKEGLDFQFKDFQDTVVKQLHDAEMEHLTVDVVDGFKQVMRTRTRILIGTGHMPWTKKTTYETTFLTEPEPLEYQSLNDHWNYPFEARLRTLAVSMGKVVRLPWEVVMFGESAPIPGLPMACRIDDELLVDCNNSRKAILKIFEKFPAETFADMRKVVKEHCLHVKEGDKFVECEFSHLENVAEKATEHNIREEIVSFFSRPPTMIRT